MNHKPEQQSQEKHPEHPDQSYGNISKEADLLRLVKDICDELHILKNLAEDQEDVWKQFLGREKNASRVFNYYTPTEVRFDIEEMIQEAESVQDAFHTLLDLRQKQANIEEARYARRQSEETRKQSQTIMVFTVITILFVSLHPPRMLQAQPNGFLLAYKASSQFLDWAVRVECQGISTRGRHRYVQRVVDFSHHQ